ncbi:FAD-dependent oxidoreductase [Nocardia sp. NPDC088792]|uniref:FAD-dependent oxidoreductase n=1 Tax=Nocardia sp. NPDC088792 TaxID=3364332 RepID=UPI00380F4C97
MRVAIVGAGLGGLGLAQRLLREGFDTTIYERDNGITARCQGYRIGFEGPGLAALRRAVPTRLHPLLDAVSGLVGGTGRVVDPWLNQISEIEPRDEGRMFDRNVLRHLLFSDVAGHVRFGMKLDRYQELPDGRVRLHFADGTITIADVVVGADGMGSTVRRQLLPAIQVHELPTYGAIGRTPMNDRFAALIPGWSTIVTTRDVQLMLGKMVFRRPPAEAAAQLAPDVTLPDTPSYVRWVLMLPGAVPQNTALAPVLDLIHDWDTDLRELLRQADVANSEIGPIREGDPVHPWPTRAVTLLGDAAHPAPPGGLGANLALMDGELLCHKLIDVRDGGTDLIPALSAYESTMCDNAALGRATAAKAFATFAELRDRS